MAAGYHASGMAEREAVFTLAFRTLPFGGGYAVAAGLDDALEVLSGLRFETEDLDHLAGVRGSDGEPLFTDEFLFYLRTMRFRCDVDAIPEGSLVFPNEPLLRVRGPLLQGQIIETPLLTLMGFQTLVATKATRIVEATGGAAVLEFGLRRAQGIDGGLAAARAAYIGGVAATSNVLAGRLYGIPIRGTHAHAWVQAFGNEQVAFDTYATHQPNNVTLLVDTYDTLTGVAHAIETGKKLRAVGRDLAGIRLDSGDLAYLSIEARKLLDAAGFETTKIVASNDLDETTITSLRDQGARIDIWGVGTRLITAYDQPALGAVYKLTAIANDEGGWRYPIKLSEQTAKISIPGVLGVRRFTGPDGILRADAIWDEELGLPEGATIVDPSDPLHTRLVGSDETGVEMVRPVMRGGERLAPAPSIQAVRSYAKVQLESLSPSSRRFLHPHVYPVGLESKLYERRVELVRIARGH
jgi:nicotinate phosphoribosyltransferase